MSSSEGLSLERVGKLLRAAQKSVVLSAVPDVFLKLRKRTNIYALEVTVGTDVQLLEAGETGAPRLPDSLSKLYKPNLHVECRDRLLGGHVGLNTKDNELTYTKKYDLQGLCLGVQALYNYSSMTPYAGFVLESTTGISSASRSNALSIRHAMDFEVAAVETRVEVSGEVKLPGTKYNAATNTVGLMVRRWACTGPIDIQLHTVTTTLTI